MVMDKMHARAKGVTTIWYLCLLLFYEQHDCVSSSVFYSVLSSDSNYMQCAANDFYILFDMRIIVFKIYLICFSRIIISALFFRSVIFVSSLPFSLFFVTFMGSILRRERVTCQQFLHCPAA